MQINAFDDFNVAHNAVIRAYSTANQTFSAFAWWCVTHRKSTFLHHNA